MKDLILLKIGGSICTEKSKSKFKVRANAVKRIAHEILEARKEKDFRLLIVNGAGPFGHVNVHKYAINNGLERPEDFEGFFKTISDCGYLNWKVSDLLRKEGLPAFPFPSSSVIVQSDKKIVSFSLDVVKRMWDSDPDSVPVMNGTMVPDIELKGSVVSGDAVLEYIASRLSPKLMIFATDVDGIFTDNPKKNKKAKLIDYVTKQNFNEIKRGISGSSNIDVTGGMFGKVKRLLSLKSRTIIVNGNSPGRVRDALLGEEVKGTIIG